MQKIILKYFCEMNIDMLELALDDDTTYQEVTKELFLKKLSRLFDLFKDANDTSLLPFKGTCTADICNKGCTGFAFVGNASKKHASFIFEGDETAVTDIYVCNSFKTERDDLETEHALSFSFSKDEEANFKPSMEYLLQQHQCDRAWAEIVKVGPSYLYPQDYLNWIEKHRALFQALPDVFSGYDYSYFNRFNHLYHVILALESIFYKEPKAQEVLQSFEVLNKDSEMDILKWLVTHEKFCNPLVDEVCYNMFVGKVDAEGFLQLKQFPTVKVEAADIFHAFTAANIYQQYYLPLLEKYTTHPKDVDFENYDWESEAFINRDSLTYHLQQRDFKIDGMD